MATTQDRQPADHLGMTLTGAQETLLVTLLAKYNDFYRRRPLLADRWAVAVIDHLGIVARPPAGFSHSAMVTMRARVMDDWATELLAAHREEPVAVIHLACGLDARALRLRGKCGADVRWIDLDLPDVIDARCRLASAMPEPAAAVSAAAYAGQKYSYTMVASDATAAAWLEDVPADRPTLVIMEGLSMYLSADAAQALIRRLVNHFAPCGGELMLDAVSPQSRAVVNWVVRVQQSFGFQWQYAIRSFEDVTRLDARLQLVQGYRFTHNPAVKLLDFVPRVVLWLLSWIPWLRGLYLFMRFRM
ncbi:O-methyltransferase-like protein [Cordyceps javanica]|uniref:O-methyltransferase-like protein n=1 Tax=Cordyceps javanica TaxID=43265 RepID=A0A545UZ90_9HYPO|nr:O-methyltransferase-like protein [Cordyceps javanica]TQW06650.1 O-methyltransferase-like protein [Cordyceps javanica]